MHDSLFGRPRLVVFSVVLGWGVNAHVAAQDQVDAIESVVVDSDHDDVLDRSGDTVRVEGLVTYEPYLARSGTQTRLVIDDGRRGLRVRVAEHSLLAGIQQWDRIRVRGVVSQDRGANLVDAIEVSVVGHGEPLPPVALKIAELLEDPELWENREILVRGKPILYDDRLFLTDGKVRVRLNFRGPVFDLSTAGRLLSSGRSVEAVGFLEQWRSGLDRVDRYRVTARAPSDVMLLDRRVPPNVIIAIAGVFLVLGAGFMTYVSRSRRAATRWRTLVEQLNTSESDLRAQKAQLRDEIHHRAEAEKARMEAERRFLQAQKMEALGTLAGGVAHDFNNLLAVMLGEVELILLPDTSPDEIHEGAQQVRVAAERARDLVRQILAFSRRQVLAPETVSLDELVTRNCSMLRRLLSRGVDLQVDTKSGALVRVDPTQFTQVLVNLATNAQDAVEGEGVFRLKTWLSVDSDAAELNNENEGPWAILEAGDDGAGMEPELLERIFEPFFTTKGLGKGTGLGLATVKGIVEQSGGQVHVSSTPGAGTRVTLEFPVVDAEQEAGDSQALVREAHG